MSHRAEQLVDQVRSTLSTHALLANVEILKHRVLSLSDEDQKLPAISISLGDDAPLGEDGFDNLAYIDSVQALSFRIVVEGADQDEEEHVITALQDLRRGIHVALMANQVLDPLTFVIGPRYGGADAPVIQGGGEHLVGQIDCRWSYHYRMNVADPQ